MTEKIVAAVRALVPSFEERAAAVDEQGRIPAETIEELTEAGVFRMMQPERYGGAETEPMWFFEAIREVSRACGSTGWVVAVLGTHPWQLALFDGAAQDDVWGTDPNALICSSYAPVGRLTPVDGGYELSGHWRFSSGCAHASWALLGGLVMDAQDRPVDSMIVLVPRADYVIEDVWDIVGLRGTASNDIVVRRAFVPEHRTLRSRDQARLRGPGQRVNSGPLYRIPFATVFTSAISAAVVGMAVGCFHSYLAAMRERVRLTVGGTRFAEDQFAQVAVARAASEIDAAILQTDRNVRQVYERALASMPIQDEMRIRVRRDQVLATERALQAIDTLFRTAGGNSLWRGNPIERAWRDAHAGSMHVVNDVERVLAAYGKCRFGLPYDDILDLV